MAEPLRYPLTTFTDKTDYLKIAIVDYIPIGKNSNNKSLVGSPQSRKNRGKNLKEVILLPMPSNISDNNAAKYGDSSLNSIIGAAGSGIIRIMETGDTKGDFVQKIKNAITEVENTASNVTTAAGGLGGLQGFTTRQLASSAIGAIGGNITPDQLLARTNGEILNPNLELLFNGPTLRTFRFQFKMVPRSKDEGKKIKEIIRAFKQYMAPRVEGASIENTFLKTPSVFELTYKQGSEDHSYLHRFKQCFLESISVNYTGAGVYSTYDDGTPVAMIMDLSFKEIEPVYDIDQKEEGGTGY